MATSNGERAGVAGAVTRPGDQELNTHSGVIYLNMSGNAEHFMQKYFLPEIE
jgi:hypothetical protein